MRSTLALSQKHEDFSKPSLKKESSWMEDGLTHQGMGKDPLGKTSWLAKTVHNSYRRKKQILLVPPTVCDKRPAITPGSMMPVSISGRLLWNSNYTQRMDGQITGTILHAGMYTHTCTSTRLNVNDQRELGDNHKYLQMYQHTVWPWKKKTKTQKDPQRTILEHRFPSA